MFQKLKNLIFKSQGLEYQAPPPDQEVAFMVMLDGQHIGTLELKQSRWYFSYSHFFKQQYEKAKSNPQKADFPAPLFGFPDVDKPYDSDILWPFFAGRIPGLKQPEVKEILEREHIDKDDLVALLTRFGKKTISNPFELNPA